MSAMQPQPEQQDLSVGRIVSVTGAKAIVLLDDGTTNKNKRLRVKGGRPEMGTLFAIETANTVVLAIVSALERPGSGAARGRERAVDRRARSRRRALEAGGRASDVLQPRSFGLPGARRPGARRLARGAGAGLLRRPAQLGAGRLHPPGLRPSRPTSASTICSASISPSSAPPAPASPARPR